MPPHSKKNKSSSKRVTLSQKKKVLKKIKIHQTKKAKQAKRLAEHPKQKKVEKESGIENDRPFDEEELKALEARRARAVEAMELRKTVQKERGQKRKLSSFEDDDSSNLADDAFAVKDSDDSNMGGLNRENGDRAFYKELVKVIELSDVILEVLDARDPLGTRCGDMEKMVRKAGPNKHLVLLLNKIDLVPRESVESWLKYLREESPTVAFKCSTQEQRSNLGWKSSSKASKSSNTLQTSDCLGAETLLKLLKNYSRSHEIKKSITVGVIGLPNVGKSSLINSLKRCRVVNVGATPGLTRSMQEVHLDKDVKLLDCPGVVILKSGENDASVALRNCKRIEKLADPVGPVNEVLKLCPAQMLVNLYKLPSFDTVDDFLQKVAIVRGKLKKGGLVDVQAAARIVLHDWNEGKIPYYTMPPTRNEGAPMEARIVSELGKEFNVDEVYNSETSFIGSLKTIEDLHTVDADVAPVCPILFDSVTVEDDVRTQASDGDQMAHDGDDQPMVNEGGDYASKSKPKTIAIKQNEKLYTAEGILNPNLKRAEKKRRKKANKSTSVDIMDGDYDTNVDLKAGSSMDDVEEDNSNDDGILGISAEVPMSGVEFDD